MIVGIDTSIMIYQAANIIGQQNGDRFVPLKNSLGEITSHLVLLYYRTISMLEKDNMIKPVFLFDGKKPDIKRKRVRHIDSFTMTHEIIETSKELITLMGFPAIQSSYESDSQGAYMVKKGDLEWFATPDIDDAFAFGCPKCLKTKLHNDLEGEFLTIDDWIKQNNLLSLTQYRDVFILIGNDYNLKLLPKGKGNQFAIKSIQKFDSIENVEKEYHFGIDFDIVNASRKYLMFPKINSNYKIEDVKPDYDRLFTFLVEENDFSATKVLRTNERLKNIHRKSGQKTLSSFFKKKEVKKDEE